VCHFVFSWLTCRLVGGLSVFGGAETVIGRFLAALSMVARRNAAWTDAATSPGARVISGRRG
jgi:hypothetical protein